MITEDYVSFEVARLLEEKGFDEQTRFCFRGDGKILHNDGSYIGYPGYYPRPTLQMAMKWLRLNHQIFIRPNTSFLYPIKWYSEIFCYGDNLKTQQDVKTEYYDSPEEAVDIAIKYCLENIID